MKASRFNVYRPAGDRTGIFNTLSGRWAWFAPGPAAALERGSLRGVMPTDLRRALSMGALVADDVDEHERFGALYRRLSRDTGSLGVVCVLTYACNLRCPYCFEDGVEGRAARLDRALLERVIAAVRERCERDDTRRVSLMLFGGEPLLEADACERLLRELHAWCAAGGRIFTGSISTNGTLVTRALLRRLAPYLDVAQVTFDGPREVHDALRVPPNGRGTYDRIVAAAHLLLEHDVAVSVRIQAAARHCERLPELARDLRERGLLGHPRVRFTVGVLQEFGCRSCGAAEGAIEPGSELYARLLGSAPELLPPPTPAVQILPCMMSGNHLCIAPDGRLYKCITEVGRPGRAVGRVDESGRFAFDAGHDAFMSRDPLQFDECRACAHLPLCGGGCPAAARNATGSWLRPACDGREALDARIDNAMRGGRP
jgi:uncharacterized protein